MNTKKGIVRYQSRDDIHTLSVAKSLDQVDSSDT